jgi:hypothetical protein
VLASEAQNLRKGFSASESNWKGNNGGHGRREKIGQSPARARKCDPGAEEALSSFPGGIGRATSERPADNGGHGRGEGIDQSLARADKNVLAKEHFRFRLSFLIQKLKNSFVIFRWNWKGN